MKVRRTHEPLDYFQSGLDSNDRGLRPLLHFPSRRLLWAGEGAGVAQAGGCWESARKTKDGERTDTSFSQQSLAAPAPLGHVTQRLSSCSAAKKTEDAPCIDEMQRKRHSSS